MTISIHVLHVEDDIDKKKKAESLRISIHVLHVEDDPLTVCLPSIPPNFNPRPPCGGRQVWQ